MNSLSGGQGGVGSISENMDELPQPNADTGGPRKVRFDESLGYITDHPRHNERLARFRRFLADGLKWSPDEIGNFLESRINRWPPVEYPAFSPLAWKPYYQRLRSHPASSSIFLAYGIPPNPFSGYAISWLDYGGFLLDELPVLKAVYSRWWQSEKIATRKKNLSAQKAKQPVKKIA
jgi:hypothetical protein